MKRSSDRRENAKVQWCLYANIWLKKAVRDGRIGVCIYCMCIKVYRRELLRFSFDLLVMIEK